MISIYEVKKVYYIGAVMIVYSIVVGFTTTFVLVTSVPVHMYV